MNKLKSPVSWLIISLILIFVGSGIASVFNSSSGKVDVNRIYFDTPNGELSGLLYKPDGADQEPKPTIIAAHGYLNSAEMQDAQAIEMSKRGYVVLALDQYDHGHSTGTMEKKSAFLSFWPESIYDAVQYMYDQDYVLKDEAGNGIIAVSGHSMGGFSSTHAVILDEQDFEANGIRKIHSSLTVGADYLWLYTMGYTSEEINNAYGPRATGKIAGDYDEFFFDAEAAPKTVVKKDYIHTEEGHEFLGNVENPEIGKLYEIDGGIRVIYQPSEIHPWNHFSMTTTEHAIDFYEMAFRDYQDLLNTDINGQTWMYKEYFSFVALIGFFLLFIPVILLLGRLPFLNNMFTKKPQPLPEPQDTGGKLANILLVVFGALFPALFFTAWYGYGADDAFYGMRLIKQVSLVVMTTSAIVMITAYVKKLNSHVKSSSTIMLILSIIQFIYLKMQPKFISGTEFFPGPTINPTIYWAINVAIVTLMIMVVYHYVSKKPQGATIANYGVKASPKSILASLLTAVISVVIGYALLFIVDAVFKTDFRIWTFAVKTFETLHVITLLKYVPLFFIYFFVIGISINMNTAGSKFDGIKGYIAAILMYVGGLILYLIYHYGLLFTTGVAGYPDQSLSSIVVIGLVPALIVAAIFNRYLFKRIGNVYVAAFLNTILMTLITVANTAIFIIH